MASKVSAIIASGGSPTSRRKPSTVNRLLAEVGGDAVDALATCHLNRHNAGGFIMEHLRADKAKTCVFNRRGEGDRALLYARLLLADEIAPVSGLPPRTSTLGQRVNFEVDDAIV